MINILILGAGYGGLTTALKLQRELKYKEANITLINKHNYHYITTHLHESAAGTINSKRIKIDISKLIDLEIISFIKATVIEINLKTKKVLLENGNILSYDILVVALGSEVETFGIKGLKEHAFTIRSINSVQLIREHIDYMFAKYKGENPDPKYLTFIVGGAGFTGIEFVGELADRIPTLCRHFNVEPEKVRLINIEAKGLLLGFDDKLVEYATRILEEKGVEFRLNTSIKECIKDGVILESGEEIKGSTVVWTGGIRGNKVIEKMDIESTRARVKVNEYLLAPGYKNAFIIGDNSLVFSEQGKPFPPTAQIATQQGAHVAKQILSQIRDGSMELTKFTFEYRGTLASIGHGAAIGRIGKWKLAGYTALFLKNMADNRYLYSIGGIPLVIKKGRILD